MLDSLNGLNPIPVIVTQDFKTKLGRPRLWLNNEYP